MIEVGLRTGAAFRQTMRGKTARVLVERSPEREGGFSGYTENYLRTLMQVPESAVGQILEVRLTETQGDLLSCEVLTPLQPVALPSPLQILP